MQRLWSRTGFTMNHVLCAGTTACLLLAGTRAAQSAAPLDTMLSQALPDHWELYPHLKNASDADDVDALREVLESQLSSPRLSFNMLQQPADPPLETSGERLRSWEMPPVTVVGETPSGLKEEDLIGSYAQPRWTATRRFPTTRVYVIPEGKIEVEGWARGTFEDDESEWRFLQEVEIGLPNRFQLDLYLRQDYDTVDEDLLWGGQFEVRWALADWGKIWGNPTLYFEYIVLESRPDKIEPKILFGGDIAEGWHWAVNFVMEVELSGEEQEHEYQVTSGLSYCIADTKFSVGVENIYTCADVAGDRGNFNEQFVIGPSFQYRPLEPMTINVAPLFGVNDRSPDLQLWMNVGWEF